MGAEASRYEPILRLAAGGMGTVWVGAARGALGFRQLVALKKPHDHLLGVGSFITELVAEARLASMIRHVNVVAARDVEVVGESITIVMDYVEGASLQELLLAATKRGERIPARVALRIALDTLAGLHAAHELVDEKGRPVALVHRDVSPQNILIGLDGVARVADFGIAKFARNSIESSGGNIKGKLAYMAPEHAHGRAIDRRADIFGLGVVLWEALAADRLFLGDNDVETIKRLISDEPPLLSGIVPELGVLDPVLQLALAKAPEGRFETAQAMATALEEAAAESKLVGTPAEVAAVVKELVGYDLDVRQAVIRERLAMEPTVASMISVTPASLREVVRSGSSPSLPAPDSQRSLEAAGASMTPPNVAAPPMATSLPPSRSEPTTGSSRRPLLTVVGAAVAGLLVACAMTLIFARRTPTPPTSGAALVPSAPPVATAPAPSTTTSLLPLTAPEAASANDPAASAAPSASAPKRAWQPAKKPPPRNPWNVNLK